MCEPLLHPHVRAWRAPCAFWPCTAPSTLFLPSVRSLRLVLAPLLLPHSPAQTGCRSHPTPRVRLVESPGGIFWWNFLTSWWFIPGIIRTPAGYHPLLVGPGATHHDQHLTTIRPCTASLIFTQKRGMGFVPCEVRLDYPVRSNLQGTIRCRLLGVESSPLPAHWRPALPPAPRPAPRCRARWRSTSGSTWSTAGSPWCAC